MLHLFPESHNENFKLVQVQPTSNRAFGDIPTDMCVNVARFQNGRREYVERHD